MVQSQPDVSHRSISRQDVGENRRIRQQGSKRQLYTSPGTLLIILLSQSEGSFRRKFDVEAATAKAKEQDKASYEHAKAAEQAASKGKRPPRPKQDLPKPTQALQARKQDLEIEKNLGKTIVVNQSAGKKGPGFYVSSTVISANGMPTREILDSVNYVVEHSKTV